MGKAGRLARKKRAEAEEEAMKGTQAGSSPAEASSSEATASFVFAADSGSQAETAEAKKEGGFTFEVAAPGALNSAVARPIKRPAPGMTDAQCLSYYYDRCLQLTSEGEETEDTLASLEVEYAKLRQRYARSIGITSANMAEDDQELAVLRSANHNLQENNQELTSELDKAREIISEYEQEKQHTDKVDEEVKKYRKIASTANSRLRDAEKMIENWETQFAIEHKHLASIIYPDKQVPPSEDVHTAAGNIIIELRRNLQEVTAHDNKLQEEVTHVKLELEEQRTKSRDLQLQKESIEFELDLREAQVKEVIVRHGGQHLVGESLVILEQQIEQAELSKAALEEENANQREEIERLQRAIEQQSIGEVRGHRRRPSSRPNSMNMGNASLAEEFGSTSMEEDDGLDYQPQVLTMSKIMTQEIVPIPPKPKAKQHLTISPIMTQEIKPTPPQPRPAAEPKRQTLSFSPTMTQEIVPREPSRKPRSSLKITPEEITQPTLAPKPMQQLSFASPMTLLDVEPRASKPKIVQTDPKPPQKLDFSDIMHVDIPPRAPRPQFRLPPPRPICNIPQFNTMSEIQTVVDIAPSPTSQRKAKSRPVTHEQLAPESQAAEPHAPIPQITEPLVLYTKSTVRHPAALALINVLLVIFAILLARLCVSRFVFYREWQTANRMGDWRSVSRRYQPGSTVPAPVQLINANGLHESLWESLCWIAETLGASRTWVPTLHWRVTEWWSAAGPGAGIGLA